jgi:hypothetical protein
MGHGGKRKEESGKVNLEKIEEKQKTVVSPVKIQLRKEMQRESKMEEKSHTIQAIK